MRCAPRRASTLHPTTSAGSSQARPRSRQLGPLRRGAAHDGRGAADNVDAFEVYRLSELGARAVGLSSEFSRLDVGPRPLASVTPSGSPI